MTTRRIDNISSDAARARKRSLQRQKNNRAPIGIYIGWCALMIAGLCAIAWGTLPR